MLKFTVIALFAVLSLLGSAQSARRAIAASDITRIQPFDGNSGWINSDPLTVDQLKGKVVLVDFWEYTCINCLRTLPYEKAWYSRYEKYGFVIVGVHTPEFAFGEDRANVESAAKRLGVTWPVVLDNNNALWSRYHNDSWPHEFLFGPDGRIALDYVGEGDYPNTEHAIQSLIRKLHPEANLPEVMALLPQDSYDQPGAVCYPQTHELYVGWWRGAGSSLGNRHGYDKNQIVQYEDSRHGHADGSFYLQGPWFNAEQAMVYARQDKAASGYDYLSFPYHAIDVVAVLKPEGSKPITVYVDQDGKPLAKADAGADLRYDGAGHSYIVVDAPRAYELVNNRHFGHHELALRPAGYGLGVYSFAFESCAVGADR